VEREESIGNPPVAMESKKSKDMDTKREFRYALIPLLYFPAFYFFEVARRAHDIDFGAYYTWAYGLRHGINPYVGESIRPLFDSLAIKPLTANYPPTFLLAFEPLTYLSIGHAFALWSAVNFALLLGAVGLLFTIVKPISRPMLFGTAALMYGPVTDALYWGQAEVVIFFLLTLVLWAMYNHRDVFCGVILGIAVLLKVYPVLFLGYFVICRRKAVVTSACLTIGVGVLVSLAVFGMPINLASLQQIRTYGGETFWTYRVDFSLGAMISRSVWLVAGHDLTPFVERTRIAAVYVAQLLVVLATIYGTVVALRQKRERLAFGLWVAAIVLINPLVWFHHLMLLLIPLALMIGEPFVGSVALKLGAASYCFAALALMVCWIRWGIWPSYDNLAQVALACSAMMGLLLAFAAAWCSCYQAQRHLG
jgi:Glycosyltransferase family 87